MITLSRQIAALEAAIAILTGSKQMPKPAQREMLIGDAKAALETLRAVEAQLVIVGGRINANTR